MRIVVEFETKSNTNNNIMQSRNIYFQNVSGKLEQEAQKFIVSLEGNAENVIDVLRNIWELAFLYDGYFYKPCQFNVDGVDENVEKLYFLSFYNTGKIWRNCASTLAGSDKDFSEERISEYSELRNKGRTSGEMLKSLINSYFYIHFAGASESLLMRNGYNVKVNIGLTDVQRQIILRSIMDSGILSPHRITSYLDTLIAQKRKMPQYNDAVLKWQKDKSYVLSYNEKEKRKVTIESIKK